MASTNKVTPAEEKTEAPPQPVTAGPSVVHSHKKGRRSEPGETTSMSSLASYETHEAHYYGHHIAATKEEIKESDSRSKRWRHEIRKFWEIFSAVLFSPVFLRHRNAFFLIVEVLVPGLVTLIIFAAFTGGISWKMARTERNESAVRSLDYGEVPMERSMEIFKETHADVGKKVLLMYTPVNNITTLIMQHTRDQLGLQDHNRIFKHGQESTGIVGFDSEIEMFERAMFHRKDFINHGKPAGVVFRMSEDDKSSVTGIPYDITFAISLFDEAIFQTEDKNPFVEPADTPGWQNPYIKSGFIGLQYAIEQSIIRLILDRQMAAELVELTGKKDEFSSGALGRAGVDWDDPIDENTFEFMKHEEVEIQRDVDEGEYPDEEEEQGGKKNLGRSLESDDPATTTKPTSKPPSRSDDSKKIVMRGRMVKGAGELPARKMKMFTSNKFGTESYRSLLTYMISCSCVMAYSFMSFFIVRQIARENLSGIKDILQLYGLPHYIHWGLLLLHAMVFRGITSSIVFLALTMNLGHGAIIKYSNKSFLFALIYIHQLALTCANYLIGIYVRSVRVCGLVAITTGVLSLYLPATLFQMKLLSKYANSLLTLIFPNWCLHHALRSLIDHETEEKEVSWGNSFDIINEESNVVSVGGAMVRLVLMGIVYYCLAAYIDMTTAAKLFPQTFKWYQCREQAKQQRESLKLHQKLVEDIDGGRDEEFEKPPVYEEPPADKKCFVHIRNISKNYGKHKVALDSINMNIMHEEVTVILGHSGSGKSTLISILAGLVQPTDGYAVVKGFDVQHDLAKAREYIGMCPQKLVAFNLLTVQQHVVLCYRLKGYSSSQSKEPAEHLLVNMRLWDVRSYLPHSLKNDELRRLGMAMALVDTPKVLLLDQPTYGMDSIGRREMWDIITTLKRHHTIVIATNYMDEAEHLADRLGFLAHGRLICYGTLSFLEDQYDTGYFLKIQPYPQTSIRLDTNAIINLVKKHLNSDNVTVRRLTRISEVDNLVLGLPMDEREQFADLCEELEGKLADFNIYRYSIRRVSLNDVFIRICSSVSTEGHGMDLYVRRNTIGDVKSVLFTDVPRLHEEEVEEADVDPDIGSEMTNRDYCIALVKKRLTVIRYGGYSVALHFIIPLIFVWVIVFQAKAFIETKNGNPARKMNMDAMKNERSLQLFYRMGTDDKAVNYSRHMSRVLGSYGKELEKTDRIVTKMFEVLRADPRNSGYVKDAHMVAFEFRKLGAKEEANYDFVGYFASGALHSAPTAVSLMTNVYLSAISAGEWPKNGAEGRSYRATAVNDPMPSVKAPKKEEGCGPTCILLGVLMSFTMSFISHYCIIVPMTERVSGLKHLQLMCGVSSSVYWFADFVIDCAIMFVVTIFIIVIFLSDLYQNFSSVPIIFSLWLICILYLLWGGLLYVYFMSTILPKSRNGYNVMIVLHIFVGIIPMLWVTFSKPGGPSGIFWRNVMEVLLPPLTVTAVFYKFFNVASQRNVCRGINSYIQEICDVRFNPHSHTVSTGHYLSERQLYLEINKNDRKLAQCCDRICLANDTCFKPPAVFNTSRESWRSPGIVTDCFALLLQGFVFWGLLLLSDTKIIQRLIQRLILRYLEAREHFDKSESGVSKKFKTVRSESRAVRAHIDEESFPENVALICVDLTKSTTSKMIIKDFCLEVKKGQCIAILGRGNSGKTCLARMIAGQSIPTKGNCYIRGSNLLHDRKHYLSCIGYSPQMNCLYPELTGAQMLELMGRLRGIPQSLLTTHVVKWLSVLGLSDVADEKCREYADGMSQRLRAAMAFIGEPEIILLDEPTSSVDPNSRQKLWSIIDHLNQQGHTIIFTTYSTEEAFSGAEKVVVIGDGVVQTIGEPDQLQRLYGKGHTILFKIRHDVLSTVEIMSVTEGRLAKFKENVHKTFRFIDLLDEQDEMLMYFLRDAKLTWAEVHRRADFLAIVHPDIVDYYEVSEGQIEDIFVLLTNKYHELGTPRKNEVPRYDERSRKDSEMHELKKAQKRLSRANF